MRGQLTRLPAAPPSPPFFGCIGFFAGLAGCFLATFFAGLVAVSRVMRSSIAAAISRSRSLVACWQMIARMAATLTAAHLGGWLLCHPVTDVPGRAEHTRARASRAFVQWGAPPGRPALPD